MKGTKIVIESAAVLCLAGVLTITAVTSSEKVTEKVESSSELENVGIAGVASVMNEYELEITQQVSVEKETKDIVGATFVADTQTLKSEEEVIPEPTIAEGNEQIAGPSAQRTAEAEQLQPELTEEEQEWQKYLMADVRKALNIRAKKSEDSEVVGKLRKGDRAVIKKVGKTWTKIASGSVTGYVKNQYCVMGSDALAYAEDNCDKIVTVNNDGLRLRKKQNESSKVVKRLSKGDVLTVDTDKETKEGWIAVETETGTGFVSSDYVTESYKTGKAVSVEEEKIAIEAAKQEKASKSSGSTKTTQGKAVEASTDEETLLAAIIQCEAGNQSYECQLAVGSVVMNRVKSGKYPNSISKVVYQKGQFGPVRNGSLSRRLKNGVSKTARKAAKEALSGKNNIGSRLYFNSASCGHSGTKIGAVVFW